MRKVWCGPWSRAASTSASPIPALRRCISLPRSIGCEGMRCVLGLFEGVVTGAADGYFRMTGTPASTLLHLGPGLANGLANLHNARKADSGIVNIVGEHAVYHIGFDAPLTSDIEGMARPMSAWVRTSPDRQIRRQRWRRGDRGRQSSPPGQIATLILPADTAWNEADGIAQVPAESQRASYSSQAVDNAAKVLRGGAPTLLLMTGGALTAQALALAARSPARPVQGDGPEIECADGARRGRFPVDRIPYVVEQALADPEGLQEHHSGRSQRAGCVLRLPEQAEPVEAGGLRGPPHDAWRRGFAPRSGAGSQRLGARPDDARPQARVELAKPTGALTMARSRRRSRALIPENAILVDESITTGRGFFPPTAAAAPHDWLQNMGGAIGFRAGRRGRAIACPDRKVICLVGDGSAMYTLQALWTQAREGLDVTTMVFANRSIRS